MTRRFLSSLLVGSAITAAFFCRMADAQIRYRDIVFAATASTKNVLFGQNINIYNSTDKLYMDIYQPDGDSLTSRPAIIYMHGGGLTSGSRIEMNQFCILFARRGYVTATIDYRTGIYPPSNAVHFAEALLRGIQDCKAAVRYLRANADKYKIDTTRIFVGGVSAGSFLSAHMAFWNQSEIPADVNQSKWGDLEGTTGNPGHSSAIQAALVYCGAINDTTYIQAGEPPVAAFHGASDTIVPVDAGIFSETGLPMYGGAAIVRVAARLGIFARAAIIPNMGHGVGEDTALQDSLYRFTARFFYDVLQIKTGVDRSPASIVSSPRLDQNYPNPFNAVSRIGYALPQAGPVTLVVYNVLGQPVITLVQNQESAGEHEAVLDMRGFTSGIYYYRLATQTSVHTKKFLLLR